MSERVAIAAARCFNHASREAVARCPHCRRFFCRECITEHDGRVVCAACLQGLSAGGRSRSRWALRMVSAGSGIALAWLVFWTIGRMLLMVPTAFHEGTLWLW